MKNLEIQLENAFVKVTAETCAKIIKKIREVEDEFWTNDEKMDDEYDGTDENDMED